MSTYKMISAEQLKKIQPQGVILDVRTHAEHVDKCLGMPHIHLPMDDVNSETLMGQHHLSTDTILYILCLGGKRAAVVADRLLSEGFKNIFVVEGGLMACEKCGHDVRAGV